jgi:hypothetical protein
VQGHCCHLARTSRNEVIEHIFARRAGLLRWMSPFLAIKGCGDTHQIYRQLEVSPKDTRVRSSARLVWGSTSKSSRAMDMQSPAEGAPIRADSFPARFPSGHTAATVMGPGGCGIAAPEVAPIRNTKPRRGHFDTHQWLNMCQAIFQQPLSQQQLLAWIRRHKQRLPPT